MWDDLLHIFYPRSYTLSNGKTVKESFNPLPYIVIVFLALVAVCWRFTRVDVNRLMERGKNFWDILVRMFPLKWDFLPMPNWGYWPMMSKAMFDTVSMSLLGSVFGCLAALPVSFYLSNNFKLNRTYMVTHRFLLSLLRTLPTLVYACFIKMVLGIGTLSGTIAISIFSYTICVKMMYEYIETLDMGAYEALESTGATRPKCMWSAMWPQVKGFYLSTVLYCFESNVKSAAILGYVGAGGIGLNIDGQLTMRKYANLGLVLLCMTVTIIILEVVARAARRKLVTG